MKKIYLILLGISLLFSCERDIELDFPVHQSQYVVEGYIERNSPPFVIISKSESYYSVISLENALGTIVQGAEITVSDGSKNYPLVEINSDNLSNIIKTIEQNSGVKVDLSVLDELLGLPQGTLDLLVNGGTDNPFIQNQIPSFSIYTSVELLGKENTTYYLTVKTPDKTTLTAQTFMPEAILLDSVWTDPHPNNDTLVTLTIRYSDDPSRANYIRYFTQRDQEPFYPPPFNSIFDDRTIFNISGETFNFPLERGQIRNDPNFEFSTFSYFNVNDTIMLRWASIDEAHYRFWSTLEFDRGQTGNPFGRPTKVKSNINGGLGIWGAYSSSFYQVLPKK